MKVLFLSLCLGLAVLLKFDLTNGYNDDHGILKWNPLWLSYPKYSAPFSDFAGSTTSRGYMYKRLMDEHERPYYNWSPYYNYFKPISSSISTNTRTGTRYSPYFVQKRAPPSIRQNDWDDSKSNSGDDIQAWESDEGM